LSPEDADRRSRDGPLAGSRAMALQQEHPSAPLTAAVLRAGQREPDLRCRGLAMDVARRHDPERAEPLVAAALRSPDELLRFDAVCTLMTSGGQRGRELVPGHMPGEPPPWWKTFCERNEGRQPAARSASPKVARPRPGIAREGGLG
jgi:hypothetical protein